MKPVLCFLVVGIFFSRGYSEQTDCYIVSEEGNKYTGNKSTTLTGRTCQQWASKSPHTHEHVNSPGAENNYCRIFTDKQPWCYTMDKNVRWEYCGVAECTPEKPEKQTYITPPGVDCYEKDSQYKGNKSVTFTGLTCQRWDQQTPHQHTKTDNPDAEENYCRIINDERPWCYTQDPGVRWEYCMVPDCESIRILKELKSGMPPISNTFGNTEEQENKDTRLQTDSEPSLQFTTQKNEAATSETAEPTTTGKLTDKPVARIPSGTGHQGSVIKDKITTSGPGSMYVTDSAVKAYPVSAAARSLTKSVLVSIADRVQTENTDMNPDVTIKNRLYESDVNKKITIQCVVKPNAQELIIHWYKDGVLLVDSGLAIMTGSLLILSNVQKKDSGLYTCEAGNSKATTTVLVGGAKLDTTPAPVEQTSQKIYTTTETYSTSTVSISTSLPSIRTFTEATDFSSTPSEIHLRLQTTTTLPPSSSVDEITDSVRPIDVSTILPTSKVAPKTTTELPSFSTEFDTKPSGSFTGEYSTIYPKEDKDTIGYTTVAPYVRVTDKPMERSTEKYYTTTFRPRISTAKPTIPPKVITTSFPKRIPIKDKFIPRPTFPEDSVVSYNVRPDPTQSVFENTITETTRKPLVVVLNNEITPSKIVNRNDVISPRQPVHQRFTVPVRVTTPRVNNNQVTRDNAERYIYVQRHGKRMHLQDEDVKIHNSYKYTPEQDKTYMDVSENQYVREVYIEGCQTMCDGESNCYLEYNCTHYQHCFEQDGHCTCMLMTCSFGTYWNQAIHVCDSIHNVKCEKDPCRNMEKYATYTSGFNCRSYYQCNSRGRSMAMCCKNKETYDQTSGRCVRDDSCDLDCTQRQQYKTSRETSPSAAREVQRNIMQNLKVNIKVTETYDLCYLRPVKNRPTKYFNDVFKVEQDCPPGTVFQAEICVCGISLKISRDIPIALYPQVCEANIQVDFSGDRVTNEARRPAYLQSTDVRIIPSGQPGINYGQFNGRTSQIFSERFFAVTFRRLFIKMLFYSDDSGGPEHQILISNCDSMAKPWDIPELGPNNKPSLAIILSRSSGLLTFLGYSEYSSPAIIRLPYSKRSWNKVELSYDGSTFSARVLTLNGNNEVSERKDSRQLAGRLAVSVQPLRIGRCSGTDAFYGYIDFIKMYNDCVPKKT